MLLLWNTFTSSTGKHIRLGKLDVLSQAEVESLLNAMEGKAAVAALPIYGDQRLSEAYKADLLAAHVSRAVGEAIEKTMSEEMV